MDPWEGRYKGILCIFSSLPKCSTKVFFFFFLLLLGVSQWHTCHPITSHKMDETEIRYATSLQENCHLVLTGAPETTKDQSN